MYLIIASLAGVEIAAFTASNKASGIKRMKDSLKHIVNVNINVEKI